MKKIILTAIIAIVSLASSASAAVYNFVPSRPDMWDLDHFYAYAWGMKLELADGEVITDVVFTIDDVNNWQPENDVLHINLLDEASIGERQFLDNEAPSNYFDGWATPHVLLTTYTDLMDAPGPSEDYEYHFTSSQIAMLNNYLQNDVFGLGLDPDCHYFNNGVKLKVYTSVVPEPATMMLLSSGLFGAYRLRRKTQV